MSKPDPHPTVNDRPPEEEWRPICGRVGWYEVWSKGRLWHVHKREETHRSRGVTVTSWYPAEPTEAERKQVADALVLLLLRQRTTPPAPEPAPVEESDAVD